MNGKWYSLPGKRMDDQHIISISLLGWFSITQLDWLAWSVVFLPWLNWTIAGCVDMDANYTSSYVILWKKLNPQCFCWDENPRCIVHSWTTSTRVKTSGLVEIFRNVKTATKTSRSKHSGMEKIGSSQVFHHTFEFVDFDSKSLYWTNLTSTWHLILPKANGKAGRMNKYLHTSHHQPRKDALLPRWPCVETQLTWLHQSAPTTWLSCSTRGEESVGRIGSDDPQNDGPWNRKTPLKYGHFLVSMVNFFSSCCFFVSNHTPITIP